MSNFIVCAIIFHLILDTVTFTSPEELQPYQAQSDYIIENGLQGSEREIHLEDFFWTGSGDGPPSYARPNEEPTKGGGGGGTIIKTATVLATVYVDGSMENLDPLCTFDCDNYDFNSVEQLTPTDRRYWLLTVVGGLFGPQDYPLLEEKLAKLYRIAFTRQQAKHLGLAHNATNTTSMERIKRDTSREEIQPIVIEPTKVLVPPQIHLNEHVLEYERTFIRRRKKRIRKRELNQNIISLNSSVSYDGQKGNYQQILVERRQNRRKVTVKIHNITRLTEDDLKAVNQQELEPKRFNYTGNQTEIIYSVFVSGKPVLATTAAKDMELLTNDEVMQVMQHPITTKAEPYLKEPLATPLVPAQANSNLIEVLGHNPLWIVVLCIIFLLIVTLVAGLLMMTRAKRKRSAELKLLVSSHHGTVSPIHHHHHHHHEEKPANAGHDNSAFSKDESIKGGSEVPVIHFPLPPPISRPTSSSSGTSDSSIYYPKRLNKSSLQELLDEKAAQLFRKKTSKHSDDDTKTKKDAKAKQKRKYLSENKVGSLEQVEVQCHSPPPESTSSSEFGIEDKESNEKTNYHKNKLLHDQKFLDRSDEDTEEPYTYNRHRHQHHHSHHETDETGSIGSYLSMISIRSFPKSMVPEPLSKVLEPSVSVTYLDQSSDPDDFLRSSKHLEPVIREEEGEMEEEEKKLPMEVKPSDGPVIYKLESLSPLRDPAETRNRFEGLIEGAIQLYTEEGGAETPEIASSAAVYAARIRENRGKSAIPYRNPAILTKTGGRPFTAGTSSDSPKKSQPPSPSRAWASGAHSPQVRPMSAGPFHKPQTPVVDVTRVLAPRIILDRSELSTAPLIEAIQNELKKFNKDNNNSSTC